MTGPVLDLAHKQLALGSDFAGEQKVKSLEEKVACWSVRMDRRNAPTATPAPDGAAAKAPKDRIDRLRDELDRWIAWHRAQPRKVRRAAGAILVLLALNIVVTGLAPPWFVIPSIPFALYIRKHRNPKSFPWQRG